MLNEATAKYTSSSSWGNTSPTATVFTASINHSNPSVAYCFHSVDGFSKVGEYKGNGNADGVFIYTGFRPAYTLIRRTDTGNDWMMGDNKTSPYNQTNYMLRPNLGNIQQSGNNVDYLSNGFKIRVSGNAFNNSSGTYSYIAFAESPFKTSNAR